VRRRVERLERLQAELGRLSPAWQLARRDEHLRGLGLRLEAAAQRAVRERAAALEGRRADWRLRRALDERFRAMESGLSHRRGRLQALSPELVLQRGYSITLDEGGHVLRSATETAPGRPLHVRLATGRLAARVEEVEP
jgi:exodeoxyribonuclease VII large subunit